MTYPAPGQRRAVVALGGNAMLRRGEPLDAANQAGAARGAARVLALGDAYWEVEPYPLDVLDAETAGQIGYVLEMQLDNCIDHQDTVTLITRVVVDAEDPAFRSPSKFIGPMYTWDEASEAADRHGRTVTRDGEGWRRVVPSPEPRRIVQLGAIEHLVGAGYLVVCAGGGGVPVVEDAQGRYRGAEAVIDKDLASSLLAVDLGVDNLVLAVMARPPAGRATTRDAGVLGSSSRRSCSSARTAPTPAARSSPTSSGRRSRRRSARTTSCSGSPSRS
jgi:carbamate kinase